MLTDVFLRESSTIIIRAAILWGCLPWPSSCACYSLYPCVAASASVSINGAFPAGCVLACGSVITQTRGRSHRHSLGQSQGVLSLLRGCHQLHVVCLCLGLCGGGCCELLLEGFRRRHITPPTMLSPTSPCIMMGFKIMSLLGHTGRTALQPPFAGWCRPYLWQLGGCCVEWGRHHYCCLEVEGTLVFLAVGCEKKAVRVCKRLRTNGSPAFPQALPECLAWLRWHVLCSSWGVLYNPSLEFTDTERLASKRAHLPLAGCWVEKGQYLHPQLLVCCLRHLAGAGFGDWVILAAGTAFQGQPGYRFLDGEAAPYCGMEAGKRASRRAIMAASGLCSLVSIWCAIRLGAVHL